MSTEKAAISAAGAPPEEVPSEDAAPAPAPAPDPDLKSPGVARIEALSAAITPADRVFIFLGVFLLAYAYGLDGTLRYTYQPYATGSFHSHSLLSTVNVLRAVISAAAQPTAAKIADVFGRVELLCVAVVFYVVGAAVEAAATDMATYAGGNVVYQVGYTMTTLLVEVIVGDITSTRARLFFSYVPALPFLINTWVSGNVADAVLGATSWHWGIGMWCVIYPVCALPLIASLLLVSRRARSQGRLDSHRSALARLGVRRLARELFWLLDVVGIVLLIAVFALLLVPLTLAGGVHSQWRAAHIIAPLVVGLLCLPAFIVWELRAPHPLVPFALIKDRSVWAPIGIAVCLNFAWTMQGDYLYTVLVVAFDFTVTAATRITSLYSFTSVIVGPLLGLVVYKVRRLKIFVIIGTCLFVVAFGLLIHYRGSTAGAGDSRAGVIAAQVVLGVAGGMFPYTAQASLQVGLKHENLAVITALYLAVYNIGSALGNTVSGALWTQLLPAALEGRLAGINSTLAVSAYGSPLETVVHYRPGTPERTAIVDAYQHIQRLLTITGICICIPLVAFSLALRNPRLTNEQTLARDTDVAEVNDAGEGEVA